MDNPKKKILKPSDTPKEVFDYWHELWAEYLNRNYKKEILDSGVAGHSFTEKTPDSPSGNGMFSYAFAQDGTLGFIEEEGESVVEYDSYDIGHHALADPNVDAAKLAAEGKLRFVKNPELLIKLVCLVPLMREAYYAVMDQVEEKFGVEMPRYQ